MRVPSALPFALLLFALLLAVPALSAPSWASLSLRLSRSAAAATADQQDTCQCDCCYSVGHGGRTECVPSQDTSFDVATCSACDVDACAASFPVACAQPSSVVNANCISREGWMLRLVPVFFIAASACLLIYGFCFKTYDGYHDESGHRNTPSLTEVLPLAAFPQSYGSSGLPAYDQERLPPASRAISLPPISETAELTGPTDPQDLVPPLFSPPLASTSASLLSAAPEAHATSADHHLQRQGERVVGQPAGKVSATLPVLPSTAAAAAVIAVPAVATALAGDLLQDAPNATRLPHADTAPSVPLATSHASAAVSDAGARQIGEPRPHGPAASEAQRLQESDVQGSPVVQSEDVVQQPASLAAASEQTVAEDDSVTQLVGAPTGITMPVMKMRMAVPLDAQRDSEEVSESPSTDVNVSRELPSAFESERQTTSGELSAIPGTAPSNLPFVETESVSQSAAVPLESEEILTDSKNDIAPHEAGATSYDDSTIVLATEAKIGDDGDQNGAVAASDPSTPLDVASAVQAELPERPEPEPETVVVAEEPISSEGEPVRPGREVAIPSVGGASDETAVIRPDSPREHSLHDGPEVAETPPLISQTPELPLESGVTPVDEAVVPLESASLGTVPSDESTVSTTNPPLESSPHGPPSIAEVRSAPSETPETPLESAAPPINEAVIPTAYTTIETSEAISVAPIGPTEPFVSPASAENVCVASLISSKAPETPLESSAFELSPINENIERTPAAVPNVHADSAPVGSCTPPEGIFLSSGLAVSEPLPSSSTASEPHLSEDHHSSDGVELLTTVAPDAGSKYDSDIVTADRPSKAENSEGTVPVEAGISDDSDVAANPVNVETIPTVDTTVPESVETEIRFAPRGDIDVEEPEDNTKIAGGTTLPPAECISDAHEKEGSPPADISALEASAGTIASAEDDAPGEVSGGVREAETAAISELEASDAAEATESDAKGEGSSLSLDASVVETLVETSEGNNAIPAETLVVVDGPGLSAVIGEGARVAPDAAEPDVKDESSDQVAVAAVEASAEAVDGGNKVLSAEIPETPSSARDPDVVMLKNGRAASTAEAVECDETEENSLQVDSSAVEVSGKAVGDSRDIVPEEIHSALEEPKMPVMLDSGAGTTPKATGSDASEDRSLPLLDAPAVEAPVDTIDYVENVVPTGFSDTVDEAEAVVLVDDNATTPPIVTTSKMEQEESSLQVEIAVVEVPSEVLDAGDDIVPAEAPTGENGQEASALVEGGATAPLETMDIPRSLSEVQPCGDAPPDASGIAETPSITDESSENPMMPAFDNKVLAISEADSEGNTDRTLVSSDRDHALHDVGTPHGSGLSESPRSGDVKTEIDGDLAAPEAPSEDNTGNIDPEAILSEIHIASQDNPEASSRDNRSGMTPSQVSVADIRDVKTEPQVADVLESVQVGVAERALEDVQIPGPTLIIDSQHKVGKFETEGISAGFIKAPVEKGAESEDPAPVEKGAESEDPAPAETSALTVETDSAVVVGDAVVAAPEAVKCDAKEEESPGQGDAVVVEAPAEIGAESENPIPAETPAMTDEPEADAVIGDEVIATPVATEKEEAKEEDSSPQVDLGAVEAPVKAIGEGAGIVPAETSDKAAEPGAAPVLDDKPMVSQDAEESIMNQDEDSMAIPIIEPSAEVSDGGDGVPVGGESAATTFDAEIVDAEIEPTDRLDMSSGANVNIIPNVSQTPDRPFKPATFESSSTELESGDTVLITSPLGHVDMAAPAVEIPTPEDVAAPPVVELSEAPSGGDVVIPGAGASIFPRGSSPQEVAEQPKVDAFVSEDAFSGEVPGVLPSSQRAIPLRAADEPNEVADNDRATAPIRSESPSHVEDSTLSAPSRDAGSPLDPSTMELSPTDIIDIDSSPFAKGSTLHNYVLPEGDLREDFPIEDDVGLSLPKARGEGSDGVRSIVQAGIRTITDEPEATVPNPPVEDDHDAAQPMTATSEVVVDENLSHVDTTSFQSVDVVSADSPMEEGTHLQISPPEMTEMEAAETGVPEAAMLDGNHIATDSVGNESADPLQDETIEMPQTEPADSEAAEQDSESIRIPEVTMFDADDEDVVLKDGNVAPASVKAESFQNEQAEVRDPIAAETVDTDETEKARVSEVETCDDSHIAPEPDVVKPAFSPREIETEPSELEESGGEGADREIETANIETIESESNGETTGETTPAATPVMMAECIEGPKITDNPPHGYTFLTAELQASQGMPVTSESSIEMSGDAETGNTTDEINEETSKSEEGLDSSDVLAALATLHTVTEEMKAVVESGALGVNTPVNPQAHEVEESSDSVLLLDTISQTYPSEEATFGIIDTREGQEYVHEVVQPAEYVSYPSEDLGSFVPSIVEAEASEIADKVNENIDFEPNMSSVVPQVTGDDIMSESPFGHNQGTPVEIPAEVRDASLDAEGRERVSAPDSDGNIPLASGEKVDTHEEFVDVINDNSSLEEDPITAADVKTQLS